MSIIGLKPQRKRVGALAAACHYALIALFAITPALGREISDAERGALKTAVSELSAAIKEGNFRQQISGGLPPRIVELLAKKGGITAAALQEQMIAIIEKTMQKVKIESFAINLEGAEFSALASGEPYALIPTTTVIVIGKSPKALAKDKTLALMENGKWYLVRVSDPGQAALFREAYPEFAQVGLPEGTMEILKNEP
jgi:hypothetical protein